MAVLYLDYFSSTLTSALDAEASVMYLPDADAALIRAAVGGSVPVDIAASVIRIPLWLDDGVNRELVVATYARQMGSTDVEIIRSSTPYAFASGTVVRCAPTADYAAAGHLIARPLETADTVIVIPGETVAWAPTGPSLNMDFPIGVPWGLATQAFTGECWPARVELVTLGVEMTVSFRFNYGSPMSVYQPDVMGAVTSVTIPTTAQMAVLTLRRPPAALRSIDGAIPRVLCNLELFG